MQMYIEETMNLSQSIRQCWLYLQLLVIHAAMLMRVKQDIVTEFRQKRVGAGKAD
jgi:hypothetical protein